MKNSFSYLQTSSLMNKEIGYFKYTLIMIVQLSLDLRLSLMCFKLNKYF